MLSSLQYLHFHFPLFAVWFVKMTYLMFRGFSAMICKIVAFDVMIAKRIVKLWAKRHAF